MDIDVTKLLDTTTPPPALPPGHTAVVGLGKGDDGPLVLEMLASGKAKAARAFVAAIADVLRRCPKFTIGMVGTDDKIVLNQSPLAGPSVGETSVAAAITIDGVPGVMDLIAFAKGRVAGALLYFGDKPDPRGFSVIARTAVRKLRNLK